MRKGFFIFGFLFLTITSFVWAAYQPIPSRQTSPIQREISIDEESLNVLFDIEMELKILNEYMSRISGHEINRDDVTD